MVRVLRIVDFSLVALFCMAPMSLAQVDSTRLVPVEFQFSKVVQPPEAGVGLNGTFNNWGNDPDGTGGNRHVIPMKNVGNDLWKVTVWIAPGKYEYKFVTYEVSGKDTTVSTWITDPLNSDFGGPYNNSRVTVADPMVYYLLPLSGQATNDRLSPITAKISWAKGSTIDTTSVVFKLDNAVIPNAARYFDRGSRTFRYTPTAPLTFDQHTAELSVSTTGKLTATLSTSFSVVNQIIAAPYTFVFDPLSPNFKQVSQIQKVEVKGTFNNLGADALAGPDSDGVYTRRANLGIGVPNFYQYIINGGQYIDDPDNPLMQKDFGTVAVKRVDPYPSFKFIQPRQGQVFSVGASLAIVAQLQLSDSLYAIDKSSVKVYLDSVPVSLVKIDSIDVGVRVQSSPVTMTAGRHQIKFVGADANGAKTEAYLTIGAFAPNSGFHYVDADFDDNGPGGYGYPGISARGSADIRQIDVAANAQNDSLIFSVKLGTVTDNSRIGLEITNSLEGPRIFDPDNASVQIPDFTNRGVYFFIGVPGTTQSSALSNKVYTVSPITAAQKTYTIALNTDAKSTGTLQFSIPLSFLEGAMGSFSRGWYFTCYSYLGNASGAMQVTPDLGGSYFSESPNIYDAAFFYNTSIQKRILSNFNFSFNYGGSRYVQLASNQRGSLLIRPGEISPSLASKPFVRILTDGGEMRWSDTVRVAIYNSDSTIANGTLRANLTSYPLNFVKDTARVSIPLSEGSNELQAFAGYGVGLVTASAKVYFNRIKSHKPAITIAKSISGGSVQLDASGTANIDNLTQSFFWTQDATNPQQVTLAGGSSASASFATPTKRGEYYFTVTCRTSKDSAFQRPALLVDSSLARFPDLATWHPSWVDSAIVYEVYVRTFSLDGDIPALTRRLSTIKDLGVNTIWLMPIHPTPQISPSQPGYATVDYYDVNAVYGTKSDLRVFVDAAHANGIRVILDHVINHTHNTHPFMLDALKYGSVSPYRDFYYWYSDGTYRYMFTWTDLPSINYDLQQNMDYLVEMSKYWVQYLNLDGYRCDVAWGVNDTRPTGPAFWQRWRRELKTMKPDIFLLGELEATKPTYFDKKFDSGYDWWTLTAMRDALSNNRLLRTLDSAIAYYTSPSYPSNARPFRFTENHDEARFISQFSVEKSKLAATMLLTLPGIPMIYAGQEVGEQSFRGLIDWTDGYALRPFYKKVISLRRAYPSLSLGRYVKVATTSPDSIFAYGRFSDDLPALVAHNVTSGNVAFTATIDTSLFKMAVGKTSYFNDVLNGVAYAVTAANAKTFRFSLQGNASAVMILSDRVFPLLTGVQENSAVPAKYALEQNYPNPFNPATTIRFSVAGRGSQPVKLEIYNLLGQNVRALVEDSRPAGTYNVQWDGKDQYSRQVASGVYFYILKGDNFVQSKKMLLLK